MEKMIIGLISDTHINDKSYKLTENLKTAFKDVDLILHAGDIVIPRVLDELEKIAPVIAVQGNMDRANGFDLPERKLIEKKGVKIGLIHGEVYPKGDDQQLYYLAKELEADILVSGHTHQPMIETVKDVLLLNPGSPTAPRLADPSVMLLKINDGEVDVEPLKVGAPVCSALNMDQFKK
ncbi:YfcE family phosphodiesterase [Methanobrevibacter sp. OttesenSCG-928-K11]|nr:YfcE family phosphodiesterase [Methanobrevibacter sp. OttesenSCG-928-K11]MDL2270570.1 YfcE family phosphodiesterase [Methanobrevibacter sp. OttesenSCG-928-I08]